MAGSFNLFRQYQKLALAALAIMAMLAFFVLPPVLQMGSGGSSTTDREVVSWKGGGLTESGLQRELITRRGLNQFLMALRVAATGDERVQAPLPDSEAAVVETLVMAREAEANGIVVSDEVVNSFLSNWTGDMVSADQIEGVIDQLRARAGITESDIFNSLRSLILSRYLQEFAIRGVDFSGAPAGWQWDDFRRLEQGATVEVVPVVAELLADEVSEPSTAALENVYERYKDDLPRARSATPGFKEPARVRYDMLVAAADLFVADAAKEVTDEAIATFYEENKEAMFAVPADEPAGEAAGDAAGPEPTQSEIAPDQPATEREQPSVDEPPAEKADSPVGEKPAPEAAPAGEATPAEPAVETTPVDPAPAATEPVPAAVDAPAAEQPAVDLPPAEAARPAKPVFRTVAFLQGEAADGEAAEPAAEVAAGVGPAAAVDPVADPVDSAAATEKPAAQAVKPLAEVREEVRLQLAREAADRKLGEIFDTIAGRIATYAEELDLAIALGNKPPSAPDLDAMAAEFGLDALRSEFVTAAEAVAGGGIGTSFQLSFSERFGVRQQRWIDMLFAPEASRWRPLGTRDVAGNRYLSWKTEDRPEFTPPFSDVRDDVERVWRLMEARPLARKRAEQVAADAAGKTLAETVAGKEGFEATTVGPFTWLTRGTAPFGSLPMLSDPEGIQMAGETFMETVFSLEPGGTAVAFNEPETVCYAIRLAGLEPGDDTLRERFLDAASDPRRLEAVAETDARTVYSRWLADVTRRQAVEWKRPPR
jgi:hypothetical protein